MTQSATFLHVLATRIGIGVYDEAWFDYRLQLFGAITVPSVASQTSQAFTWLLVVDQDMPPVARSRFHQAIATLTNAVVLPVEFKTDFRRAVIHWSRKRAQTLGVGYVMTSRLDDDDAMRVDALARLQDEAAEFARSSRHRYAVFSLDIGCMWLPTRRLAYTRYHDSIGLGLSVVEPADVCRSVYGWPHAEIKQRLAPRGTHFRSIAGDHCWWLYAAHQLSDSETGQNKRIDRIANHRYGYRVDDALLTTFGLDPATVDALGRLAEPEPQQPTKFLSLRGMEAEREIKELRARIKRTPRTQVLRLAAARRRLKWLEEQRLAVGTGIIRSGRGDATGSGKEGSEA